MASCTYGSADCEWAPISWRKSCYGVTLWGFLSYPKPIAQSKRVADMRRAWHINSRTEKDNIGKKLLPIFFLSEECGNIDFPKKAHPGKVVKYLCPNFFIAIPLVKEIKPIATDAETNAPDISWEKNYFPEEFSCFSPPARENGKVIAGSLQTEKKWGR